MNTMVNWALTYIKDGKRLTAAFIALYQLLGPKLKAAGIDLPAGTGESGAAWLAVAVLNLWSKFDSVSKPAA